ncbi:MAG: peptide ABC transporter permease [Dictyoglomus sp. NZ13-RE01]|nr:MAG: peptide ABC transporter permease [Dictyoglomus sp. NZ13-RE01]
MAVSTLQQRRVSYWSAAWRRFKRNKMALIGGIYVIITLIMAIFTPWIAPYRYDETHYEHAFEPPSAKFIFGTDDLGRDMFSRILYALRNAYIVGFGSQLVTLIIGVTVGAIAGFRGGLIDTLLMRLVDIMYAFPTFLLNIILVAAFGRGLHIILLAIGITGWAGMARLVRGQVLWLRNSEFVEAARALGAKEGHIIRKYILPNMLGPIVISVAFGIPNGIWIESGMALLGMGVRPPMPSLGAMISYGLGVFLGLPHLAIFPTLFLTLTLLAFTFFGDGLRDALNPRSEV